MTIKPPKAMRAMEDRFYDGRMVRFTPGGRGYGVLPKEGKGVFERTEVTLDEFVAGPGRHHVHWIDTSREGAVEVDVSNRGPTPAGTPRVSPRLSPSPSEATGTSRVQITPDIREAIDAAPMFAERAARPGPQSSADEVRHYTAG